MSLETVSAVSSNRHAIDVLRLGVIDDRFVGYLLDDVRGNGSVAVRSSLPRVRDDFLTFAFEDIHDVSTDTGLARLVRVRDLEESDGRVVITGDLEGMVQRYRRRIAPVDGTRIRSYMAVIDYGPNRYTV